MITKAIDDFCDTYLMKTSGISFDHNDHSPVSDVFDLWNKAYKQTPININTFKEQILNGYEELTTFDINGKECFIGLRLRFSEKTCMDYRIIETFKNVFDMDSYNDDVFTRAVSLGPYRFSDDELWDKQKLHYMIKNRDSRTLYTDTLYAEIPEVQQFVGKCEYYLKQAHLDKTVENRYAYLTIDTRFVKAGTSQRDPGWHIDCVQGDEVPVKKPGNIAFSWCDTVPTEYAFQQFDTVGCDISKHNVFEFLGDQVQDENITKVEPDTITLMNTYCVHRAAISEIDTSRRFVRISYTHCPITNKRMHLNPDIEYDYPVHSTDGVIPEHLI